MKQVISFEKEIAFKTMIGEITSISLEHTLTFEKGDSIVGDLIVSGTYKMTEASTLEEEFEYRLPVEILLTNELEEEGRNLSIDNFTYDIVNEEILHIYVDILVQGREKIEIEEKEEEIEEKLEEEVVEVLEELPKIEKLEEEVREEKIEEEKVEEVEETREEGMISESEVEMGQNVLEQMSEEEVIPKEEEVKEVMKEEAKPIPVMNSIFSAFKDTEETYTTYSVAILRENDTVEDILTKYGVTREELAMYNNLEELKVGCKLIIPTIEKDAV